MRWLIVNLVFAVLNGGMAGVNVERGEYGWAIVSCGCCLINATCVALMATMLEDWAAQKTADTLINRLGK